MKKTVTIPTLLLITAVLLCIIAGCDAGPQTPAPTEDIRESTPSPSMKPTPVPTPLPYDKEKHDEVTYAIGKYKAGDHPEEKQGYEKVKVNATELFTNWIRNPLFYNIQGGYFDGEYYYVGFARSFEGRESAVIGVFDKNGEYVKESDELDIHHANSISDMGDGTLIVTDNDSDIYTMIDKTTLTLLLKGRTNFDMLSLDYCIDTGTYASCGTGYGDLCRILDYDMNLLLVRKMDFEPGSAPQNFFCTADALYAPRYIYDAQSNSYTNYIYEYSWTLGLREIYSFEAGPGVEVQSVSIVDHKAYAICGDHIRGTMVVYQLDMDC